MMKCEKQLYVCEIPVLFVEYLSILVISIRNYCLTEKKVTLKTLLNSLVLKCSHLGGLKKNYTKTCFFQ